MLLKTRLVALIIFLLSLGWALIERGNIQEIMSFLFHLSAFLFLLRYISFQIKNEPVDRFSYRFILFLSWAPLLYVYTRFGIPIYQDNPELARVKLLGILGPVERLCFSAHSFLVIISLTEYKLNKFRSFLTIIVTILLAYMSGYRSRVMDIVLIGFFLIWLKEKELFNVRLLVRGLIIGIGLWQILIFLTSIRFTGNASEVLLDRILYINWNDNIWRIKEYISTEGYLINTYGRDIVSVLSSVPSTQELLTFKYGTDRNFIMTLTSWGEAILGGGLFFGVLKSILFMAVIISVISFIKRFSLRNSPNLGNLYLLVVLYQIVRDGIPLGLGSMFATRVLPTSIILVLVVVFKTVFNGSNRSIR